MSYLLNKFILVTREVTNYGRTNKIHGKILTIYHFILIYYYKDKVFTSLFFGSVNIFRTQFFECRYINPGNQSV